MATATIPGPEGLPDFRKNITIALFEAETLKLFVGTLLPRANDKRDYTASLIEGGVDIGETVKEAALRELLEEVGVKNATLLTAVRAPLLFAFEDRNSDTAKYSGKQSLVLCFLIPSSDQIILAAENDAEGNTFVDASQADCWFKFSKAATLLRAGSHTKTHQRYTNELIEILEPVVAALDNEWKSSANLLTKPAGFLADKLDAKIYARDIPEPFPILAPTIVRAKLRSLADAC